MPPKRARNAASASTSAAGRRPPRKADAGDDISSQSSGDEGQDGKRGSSSLADDPFFVETAAEKKVRIAKEYLNTLDAQLAADGSDDEGGGGGDAVGEKLKRDAVMLAGKVQHRISQQLQGQPCSVQFRRGHESAVTSIAASRDNSKLVSGGKDGAVYMWNVETGHKQRIFPTAKRFGPAIFSVAVSDDGAVAAWAGADKKVYAHDFRSGKAAEPFVGHRAAITSLAFRCNTRQLFSGSHDRTVKVWNMDEMCYIETLYGHHSEVLGLDSLNQERALSVGSDRTLRLWKVVDETQLIFRGHEASIDCVSMTNEEIFVSGSQDGAVAVWSVRKKKPIASRPRAHGLGGCDVANSLDNWISSVAAMRFTDVFASGSCDGVVRLWQLGADNFGMNEICSVEVKGWVNSMCFSHDRRFLFCGVGREHRLGRWFTDESARDGIAIVSLPPIDLQQQNSA